MSQPLTSPQLNKAIRKLVAGLEKKNRINKERRAHQRHPFNVAVHVCQKAVSGEYHTLCDAWAKDISVGGIGLLMSNKLSQRDDLYINLESILGVARYLPIRICSCQNLIENIYLAHGEFIFNNHKTPNQAPSAA